MSGHTELPRALYATNSLSVELPRSTVEIGNFERVRLAGRKYHSYNPHLPTLRRMDMDDVGKKEPHEHSRTTTFLREGDFEKANTEAHDGSRKIYIMAPEEPPKKECPTEAKEKKILDEIKASLAKGKTYNDFRRFKKNPYDIDLESGAFKKSLSAGVGFIGHYPKPVPFNVTNVFRVDSGRYSRNISTAPFKPAC